MFTSPTANWCSLPCSRCLLLFNHHSLSVQTHTSLAFQYIYSDSFMHVSLPPSLPPSLSPFPTHVRAIVAVKPRPYSRQSCLCPEPTIYFYMPSLPQLFVAFRSFPQLYSHPPLPLELAIHCDAEYGANEISVL